jgi:hypothetical protein
MNDRLIHLRIKIKTLAAEAALIRFEANKVSGIVKQNLNQHRTEVVRRAARNNLLAYGLIRGILYQTMEAKCHEVPNWKEVMTLARRFSSLTEEQINEWITAAQNYIKTKQEIK